MESKLNVIKKMTALSEATNHAVKHGYTENFKFVLLGLTTDAEEKYYSPSDINIAYFFSFEGYSDPQRNAILYLIETGDRKKGTLIDAYGAYSDAKISTFIRAVRDTSREIIKINY